MSAYNTKNHPLLFYQQQVKTNHACVFKFKSFNFFQRSRVLFHEKKENRWNSTLDTSNAKAEQHTLKDIQRNDQSYPKKEKERDDIICRNNFLVVTF